MLFPAITIGETSAPQEDAAAMVVSVTVFSKVHIEDASAVAGPDK